LIGWIGTILLLLAYTITITKNSRFFPLICLIASIFLTIHAILIKDIPFIIVNGWASIVMCIGTIKIKWKKK